MSTKTLTPEIEVLNYLNEVAGKRFKPIKVNLNPISARFNDGYTLADMMAVIAVKTMDWKNNEVMAVHLCPTTLFRPSNFEKYINQVLTIQQNPEMYKQHYERINQSKQSAANSYDPLDNML